MSRLHHVLDMTNLSTSGDCFYNLHYEVENPGDLQFISVKAEFLNFSIPLYLGIFVNECQSIWYVVVTKMNNTGANPGANLSLSSVDDLRTYDGREGATGSGVMRTVRMLLLHGNISCDNCRALWP